MTRTTLAAVALAAGTVFAATSASQAALTHLYTFNNGNVNDSVGSANGNLVVGTGSVDPINTGFSNGMVNLDNGRNNGTTIGGQSAGASYVNIPASVIPTSGSVTIETFHTLSSTGNFSAVLSASNGQGQFILEQSSRDGTPNGSLAAYQAPMGTQVQARNNPAGQFQDTGNTFFTAVVVDGAASTLSYYINGTFQSSIAIPAGQGLDSLNLTEFALGRAPFNDPGATGSFDELRIYNDAQSLGQIATTFAAGPSQAVPEPASLGLLGLGGLALLNRRRRTA